MLGEMHGYAVPQQLDLALLKHLNQKIGVRIYLAEIDPAEAIAFNFYLKTRDETFMRDIFNNWRDSKASQWGNNEVLAKVRGIREFNQVSPEGR